jgi:hypothetical protein
MKKCLWTGLLGLALLAVPARAHAWGCCSPGCGSCQVQAGINVYGRIVPAGPAAQCGPWYLYWPMEAHFGPPAPTGYPNWPPPMTLPGQAPPAAAAPYPVPPPGGQPVPVKPAAYQPVGFWFQQTPSYWYPR